MEGLLELEDLIGSACECSNNVSSLGESWQSIHCRMQQAIRKTPSKPLLQLSQKLLQDPLKSRDRMISLRQGSGGRDAKENAGPRQLRLPGKVAGKSVNGPLKIEDRNERLGRGGGVREVFSEAQGAPLLSVGTIEKESVSPVEERKQRVVQPLTETGQEVQGSISQLIHPVQKTKLGSANPQKDLKEKQNRQQLHIQEQVPQHDCLVGLPLRSKSPLGDPHIPHPRLQCQQRLKSKSVAQVGGSALQRRSLVRPMEHPVAKVDLVFDRSFSSHQFREAKEVLKEVGSPIHSSGSSWMGKELGRVSRREGNSKGRLKLYSLFAAAAQASANKGRKDGKQRKGEKEKIKMRGNVLSLALETMEKHKNKLFLSPLESDLHLHVRSVQNQ